VLTYECGFSPILGQTRNTFHISFFLIALAFLILDLEILLFFPLSLSLYEVGTFGLIIGLTFFIILTIGYAIEILAGNLRISNTNLSIRNSSTQRSA
jgi:NADH-ubiquinone oxidoreductase chain 3